MAVIWEPALDPEGQKWVGLADELTREHFEPLAEELDRDQRYPWESVQKLVDSGLAGLFVPQSTADRGPASRQHAR